MYLVLLSCSKDLFRRSQKRLCERDYLQGDADKILLEGLNLPSEWMLQHPPSEWMLQKASERSWRGFGSLAAHEDALGAAAGSCGGVVESSARREGV